MEESGSPPEVVFLGFCERAEHVRVGNTNVFHWNVLGLRNVVLSHIFPLSFNGWSAGFAIPQNALEREIKLRILDEDGKEIGSFNLLAKTVSADTGQSVHQCDTPPVLIPEHGRVIVFTQMPQPGWLIPQPGVYYVEQQNAGNEATRVGTLIFALIDPAPLTPERVAAIKSDPGAAKVVKIVLGCNQCPSKKLIYSAIERSLTAGREESIWYEDCPDRFICECGKTDMDLQYIRRNLHGLLGHRPEKNSGQLSFVPMYEKSFLESIRSTFAQLLSEDPREELLQQFIDKNPVLLHQFPAERILTKPKILTSYVADFGIVTPQKELILVEIEKTSTRLMKKDGGSAAPLNHAIDQVENWLHEANEHRLAVLDSLEISRDNVSVVKGVVIAGRDSGYDAASLRKLKGRDRGKITFLTYDDLLFSFETLIRSAFD